MSRKQKCMLVVIYLFVGLFLMTGCGYYVLFTIDRSHEDFVLSSTEVKETMIRSGQMDRSRYQDVIICPNVRMITHEECRLDILAYTFSPSEQVMITRAALFDKNGKMLCMIEEHPIDFSLVTEAMYKGGTSSEPFEMTDEWFAYDETIILYIDFTIGSEEFQSAYTITIRHC